MLRNSTNIFNFYIRWPQSWSYDTYFLNTLSIYITLLCFVHPSAVSLNPTNAKKKCLFQFFKQALYMRISHRTCCWFLNLKINHCFNQWTLIWKIHWLSDSDSDFDPDDTLFVPCPSRRLTSVRFLIVFLNLSRLGYALEWLTSTCIQILNNSKLMVIFLSYSTLYITAAV
jgi:hypothetical protein